LADPKITKLSPAMPDKFWTPAAYVLRVMMKSLKTFRSHRLYVTVHKSKNF